jgi:hypothetical protein
VKRRSPIVLLALAVATLAGGCTTFSDDNVAVRVDDTSYSHDELDDLAKAAGLPENELESIRLFATDLVLVTAIDDWLDEAGLSVTDADREAGRLRAERDVPGLAELSEKDQTTFTQFFAVIERAGTVPDLQTSLIIAVADADIYVDSRIGFFDPEINAVVPLG